MKLPGIFQTLWRKKILVLGVLLVLSAAGGAIYYFLFLKPKADETPPSITITSPTADEWYAASEDSVALEGFVVDTDSGVKEVTWSAGPGQSGSATVSDKSWSIAKITLAAGDNTIVVTATDNKGNSATATLNVVYNADVLFYDLTLSQDFIYKSASPESITVRAGVEPPAGKTLSAVKLYEVVDGTKTELVSMLDNGEVANGDDIPADNIYSAIYSFASDTTKTISLRVGATIESNAYYSGLMLLKVIDELSEENFNTLLSKNSEASTKFEEIKKTAKTPQAAAKEMAEWLAEQENVEIAGTSEGGTGVWWKDKTTGILMGMSQFQEGTRNRGEINTEAVERQKKGTPKVKGLTHMRATPVRFGTGKPAYAAEEKLEVKSTKAIYLGPYFTDFGNTDDYHYMWDVILKSKCPECTTVEKKDTAVTVEDFKTLNNYGLIVISSHGDSWFDGAFGTAEGQVITHTSQAATLSNRLTYLADLVLERLAIFVDINGNSHYVVLPSFIRRYNGTFPNSVVSLATCRSSFNFTMASAYLSKGAKTFLGFSEYVWSDYAGEIGETFMKSFLEQGKTSGDSWADAIAAHGADDGDGKNSNGSDHPAAFYDIWGYTNLKMGGSDLQNGGFEDKLLGWNTEGDARVITSLASLKPQGGKRMAIISTGLGSVSDSISTLSQTLCAKEGKLTVSFKYEFVSEEPMEFVGSAYDDYFSATIEINDTPTALAYNSINTASWSPIGGINFAGGDSTTFHTGWATVTKDMGAVKQGDVVKLILKVGDKGDSIYDSAALIDDVKVEIEAK